MENGSAAPVFEVGRAYTRNDIYAALSLPEGQRGGDWLNGYHRHGSDYYIFCNVGVAGRTGHDYENCWDGDRLLWYGKTKSHFGQQAIQNLISGQFRVLIFYRGDARSPFVFAGIGRPIAHRTTSCPVRIDWVVEAANAPIALWAAAGPGSLLPPDRPSRRTALPAASGESDGKPAGSQFDGQSDSQQEHQPVTSHHRSGGSLIIDLDVFEGSEFQRRIENRPLHVTPNGSAGVVFRGKVYELHRVKDERFYIDMASQAWPADHRVCPIAKQWPRVSDPLATTEGDKPPEPFDLSVVRARIAAFVGAGVLPAKVLQDVASMSDECLSELLGLLLSKSAGSRARENLSCADSVSLLDPGLVRLVDTMSNSVRLANALKAEVSMGGQLPTDSAFQFFLWPPSERQRFQKISNIGLRSFRELEHVVDEYVSELTGSKPLELARIRQQSADKSQSETEELDWLQDESLQADELGRRLYDELQDRTKAVLGLRARGQTLQEVGDLLGVSRERIRQVEAKARKSSRLGYAAHRLYPLVDEAIRARGNQVAVNDVAEAIGLHPGFIYLLSLRSDATFTFRKGRVGPGQEHLDPKIWTSKVNAAFLEGAWPASLQELSRSCDGLSVELIRKELEGRYNVKFDGDISISASGLPVSKQIVWALKHVGRPVHFSDLAALCNRMFASDAGERAVHGSVGRLPEALIVDRGVYAHYECVFRSAQEPRQLTNAIVRVLEEEGAYLHAGIIAERLDRAEWPKGCSPTYVTLGVAQDDSRFSIRRGLMVGLAEFADKMELRPLSEEVAEYALQHQGCTVGDVVDALASRRQVLPGTVANIIRADARLCKAANGAIVRLEEQFGSVEDYRSLVQAIKIAASGAGISKYELLRKLESSGRLGQVEVSDELIEAALWKMVGEIRVSETGLVCTFGPARSGESDAVGVSGFDEESSTVGDEGEVREQPSSLSPSKVRTPPSGGDILDDILASLD